MKAIAQTYDLIGLAGITAYIEGIIQHDIRAAFERHKHLHPFGVALGEKTNGTQLPRPQPMIPTPNSGDHRVVRRVLRKLVLNSYAKGAIFCRMVDDPTAITIQLEHEVHGDHLWVARIVADKLLPFSEGSPLADARFEIPQTTLMKSRYMQ